MQIVILAGGKGTRMRDRTVSTPKPLLEHKGKTLLEHKLDSLPSRTSEVIIVIGYLGEQIRNKIGTTYNELPVRYVEQDKPRGTAHALWCCKEILRDRFMVLMGDDTYDIDDLQRLSELPQEYWGALVKEQNVHASALKFIIDGNDFITDMRPDKDGLIPYNYLYTGACVLTPKLFQKDMVAISETEFGLPQTFVTFVPDQPIKIVRATNWKQISCPEDLE